MNQEKILKLEKEMEKMFEKMTPQEAREENWHFFFAPSLREYVIQTDPSFKEIYQATDKALPKIKASIFAEILKKLCFKSIEFLVEEIFFSELEKLGGKKWLQENNSSLYRYLNAASGFQIIEKENLKEKISQIYDDLPEKIRQALFSYENAILNLKICQKFGISEEKVSQLSFLVGEVLLGILNPKDLPEKLSQNLGISPEDSLKIFHLLSREIFFPLKEKLKEVEKLASKVGLKEEKEEQVQIIEETVNLKEILPEIKEEKLKREKALNLTELMKEKEPETKPQPEKREELEIKPEPKKEKTLEEEKPIPKPEPSFKPEFKISLKKEKIKPIADIEKPKIEFEEVKEREEEPLFGKIEFPREKKEVLKKPPQKPEIKEIEYKKPEPKSPFKKPLDFSNL